MSHMSQQFTCYQCRQNRCVLCIDVSRVLSGYNLICKCDKPNHDGEPNKQQILDPETKTVHGPGIAVSVDGLVLIASSIVCPKCKRRSHNPNDIENKYCGHCHLYHDRMDL